MLDVLLFIIVHLPVFYSLFYSTWLNFFISFSFVYFLQVILPTFFGLIYMTGDDAVYFDDCQYNKLHNQGALILDRMSSSDFLALLKSRGFANHEKFRYAFKEIIGRVFFYKVKNFSLENHFVSYNKSMKSIDELYAYKEEIFMKSFPKDMPPWQVHFIENYESDKSVIIFKSHHSLCDGLALISLIISTSDPIENASNYIIFKRGNFFTTFMFYVKALIMFPYHALVIFTRIEPKTPIHGQYTLNGNKSIAVSKEYPLSNIKQFCSKENISINTLMFGVICGVLQKYFADNNVFVKASACSIPFSLRMLPKDNKALPLVNDIAYLVTNVPLDIKDETTRFRIFNDLCEGLKNSSQPFANSVIAKIIGAVMPKTLRHHFVEDFGNRTSFIFTNVPGPNRDIFFSGRKVHKIFFASPMSGNNTVSFNCFSFNGNLTIGVTCDKGVIKEAKTMIKYVENALVALGI